MHWFFASLIAPFIWSLVNHADKLLLSRYFHGGGSGGLMIFVGVVAVPSALLLAIYNPMVLAVEARDAWMLIASGILYNIAAFWYLKVLEKHDTSYVVPFWQLVPVCAYAFGILFLGEYIAAGKLIGGALVILGAVLLSVQFGAAKMRFDILSLLLMLLSSATLALGYVVFKDVDESLPFILSMFWNQIGMILFGAAFFTVPTFRQSFISVVQKNSRSVLGLNIAEQILEIAGVVAANFAVLLAPAAMVILVEYSFQPLFVFLFGILFTILFPKLVQEDISKRVLLQKIVAITIMTIGLVFVVR